MTYAEVFLFTEDGNQVLLCKDDIGFHPIGMQIDNTNCMRESLIRIIEKDLNVQLQLDDLVPLGSYRINSDRIAKLCNRSETYYYAATIQQSAIHQSPTSREFICWCYTEDILNKAYTHKILTSHRDIPFIVSEAMKHFEWNI